MGTQKPWLHFPATTAQTVGPNPGYSGFFYVRREEVEMLCPSLLMCCLFAAENAGLLQHARFQAEHYYDTAVFYFLCLFVAR